jgi:hypothetical protein
VYQVARGFWTGTYAGLDFLLSAALLLVAYLFVVRFAVHRALGLRARRLLAEVILRTRQALGAHADAGREAVRVTAARYSAALDRLAVLGERWRADLR